MVMTRNGGGGKNAEDSNERGLHTISANVRPLTGSTCSPASCAFKRWFCVFCRQENRKKSLGKQGEEWRGKQRGADPFIYTSHGAYMRSER